MDPPPLLVLDILPEARSALSSSMIQMGPISSKMNMSVPKDTLHKTGRLLPYFYYNKCMEYNEKLCLIIIISSALWIQFAIYIFC